MSKISVIAKLTAAAGSTDDLGTALADLIEAANDEHGLEIYSVHRANDEADTFYFFELYRDGDAIDEHGKGDAMKAAMAAVGTLLAGRPEVIRMTPVAAKGLAL
ncbi:MAG: putative quinol monooxygenase [Ilumatobacteraceae bacterium]